MTIIYHLDSINKKFFPKVNTIEDLKNALSEMFSYKGLSPDISIENDFVKIDFNDNLLFKVQTEYKNAINYAEKGLWEKALRSLNNVVSKCPLHSEAYRNIAQIKMLKKDIDGAIDSLIDALRVDPQNTSALILMGNIYAREKNDTQTASLYYDKALKVSPDNCIAINNIAGVLLNAGKIEEGEEYLKKAYEINPKYPNTTYGLGMVARMKKDHKLAFTYAMESARIPSSIENPELRSEILKLLLLSAKDYSSNFDALGFIKGILKKLEAKGNHQIRIEADPHISTLAKLEYYKSHHRPYNLIKYKNESSNVMHQLLHELMHLDLIIEAEKQGRNLYCSSDKQCYNNFLNRFQNDFRTKLPILGDLELNEVMRKVFDGLNTQILNSPLDLFVETKIYNEYTDFRPLQLLSLFQIEQNNIDSASNKNVFHSFPDKIISINKTLNLIASYLLKKLYTLDFRKEFHPTKRELDTARDLFEQFQVYNSKFTPGDEYDLLKYYAKVLEVDDFFNLISLDKDSNYTYTDQYTEFKIHKDVEDEISLVSHLVKAINFFNGKSIEDVKRVAVEIAVLGQNGISTTKDSGYKITSIPNVDFGGKELLAFYYVSWAIAFPDMVDKLGLPYAQAYKQAKEILIKD